ncbi:glucosaminidase domain-containing protein [Gramella sp. GC03-9]|uniref:Peptidoglycan hydrolase n=1 Tax=Christiangramia oceanisediminis TaxID=2920386 RepID=A0A9X2I2G3_9FLAO|nr:glucosaminidase domain-containing protein [Gramella oceanisediminis]MCP9198610.1 glucosaminidase domain-containing protein [Gramella oceanisediminis]
MRFSRILAFLIFAIFASSCGSKRKVVTTKKEEQRNQDREVVTNRQDSPERPVSRPGTYSYSVESYISEFAPLAQEEMRLYRIPASITLAQGILESGAGNGDLTRRANNHFGIKCHDWEGERVYHDDDKRGECFRKYKHARYSFRDHSLFLTGRGRYAELFDLDADDYKGWAKGLRKAGYATDRKYPDKLISLIERYELYRYDSEILGSPNRRYSEVTENTRDARESHVVQKGDTLYSIAKRYNTTVENIKRNNGLNGNTISIGQVLNIK